MSSGVRDLREDGLEILHVKPVGHGGGVQASDEVGGDGLDEGLRIRRAQAVRIDGGREMAGAGPFGLTISMRIV